MTEEEMQADRRPPDGGQNPQPDRSLSSDGNAALHRRGE